MFLNCFVDLPFKPIPCSSESPPSISSGVPIQAVKSHLRLLVWIVCELAGEQIT